MKLISGVIFFTLAIALSNAGNAIVPKQIANEQFLVRSLMNTKSNYAVPCFNLYMPIYDEILQEFSESYQLCETRAVAAKNELSEEAEGNKTLMVATSDSVCKSMTDCADEANSLDFLDCYSQVGDPNIKTLYSLTNDATDLAAELREQEQIIEVNQLKCQNASERAYTESTVATTEALDTCFKNGPPEVVTTTTEQATTTTEAVETTTEAVETTTEAVVTTTEAVETTTEAVVTTTEAVAEDTTTAAPLEEDLSRSVKSIPKTVQKKIWRGNSRQN